MTNSPPILHLYRHLLRESSRLTLPQSRIYFKQHVTSSFRKYSARHEEVLNRTPQQGLEWQTSLLRRARKLLSLLTRANLGHVDPFTNVLKLTFARKGPRRRQIMHNLMHPSAPAEPHPSPSTALSHPGTSWQPPATIQALLHSQKKQQGYFTQIDYKIRPQGPDLPDTNIWGKPMPRRRVKNAWAKWYAKYADRLYPPLPESEYQDILAIAQGWTQVEGRVPRPRGTEGVLVQVQKDNVEEKVVRSILCEPQKKPRKLLGRHITSRFVQRRMADLLGHIPRTRASSEPDRPVVFEWADSRAGTHIPVREASTSQREMLFG